LEKQGVLEAAKAQEVEKIRKEAADRLQHDPTKVYGSVSDLFPYHRKAQTMREWLAFEVQQVLATRGAISREPTEGIRIWLDVDGKIRLNPKVVPPAQQRHRCNSDVSICKAIRKAGRSVPYKLYDA